MAKALPLTTNYLSPLPGFESRLEHVRGLPVTLDEAVVFAGYSATCYNWLVTTQPQYGRKSDHNPNFKSIFSASHIFWCVSLMRLMKKIIQKIKS